ncbi:hypothetical protein RJ639_025303 [Escallonia herrerae]|uniref:Reverse transcriptase/retrotransposon-derived protein RNase H-like domain-containing protein n=1 Tax=Escallonia herrerae TaxID=1293975 RepID=A0AA88UXI0_9ASTE|nr:hypothetical protein RJ639_025303 [Escallonia herrerae]
MQTKDDIPKDVFVVVHKKYTPKDKLLVEPSPGPTQKNSLPQEKILETFGEQLNPEEEFSKSSQRVGDFDVKRILVDNGSSAEGYQKGKKRFFLVEECHKSFKELKKYLVSSPLLTKPITGEDLFLYLSVSEEGVSMVLIREEKEKQKHVYYISKVLQDVERRNPQVDKMAVALITLALQLQPYFQSYTITVLTDQPLAKVLQSPEALGGLANWHSFQLKYDSQKFEYFSFRSKKMEQTFEES